VDRVIQDSDIVIESGRATGGRMFVRVSHRPTDTSQQVVGLGGRPYWEVVAELQSVVEDELVGRGWLRAPGGGGVSSPEGP